MTLNNAEKDYYARHLSLDGFGEAAQESLKSSSVLIIGLGGLGTPAAQYIARAGVGRIGLIDFDVVDASNLQRQILYNMSDVGYEKAEIALKVLRKINPHILFDLYKEKFSVENAQSLVKNYDLIIDGSDNFQTRYLINDACVIESKPFLSSAVEGFEGIVGLFDKKIACYRCLYPQVDSSQIPSCSDAGVLGVTPGFFGLIQATEAVKFLGNIGECLSGKVLKVNLLNWQIRKYTLTKDKSCPICSENPKIKHLEEEKIMCDTGVKTVSKEDLENRKDVFYWIDVRSVDEFAAGHIAGALNIPLDEIASRKHDLPVDKPLALYCLKGKRCRVAYDILSQENIPNIHVLDVGYESL